ncbi:MAG: hypothetical protein F6K30_21070 [Cyanothece sp. SIO2G6]|nr:hypothetical protein [Cyanothece sp. SIO2G6]
MAFFRQYIAPLFIVLIFLVAMVAVSARIFLPTDLAAPAPMEAPSMETPSVAAPSEANLSAPTSMISPAIHG